MTLCVYALTVGAARVSARGLAGERLRLYAQGPVAAVAGRLSRVPAPAPDSLRRFDGAMRRLAATLPALLPVRFGTCFTDPEELAFILRSRRPALVRALRHVRHRVQMTVRLIDDSPQGAKVLDGGRVRSRVGAAGAAPSARARGAGRPLTGTAYLHARADAAREHEVAGFDPVRTAVQSWLRDERVDRRGAVVSIYHLIPRAAADRYRLAVARAAAATGLRVIVSGPWPAYAFAGTLL